MAILLVEICNLEWPETLKINAWTGEEVLEAELVIKPARWGAQGQLQRFPQMLAAPAHKDFRDWSDEEVGWGVVLPENKTISEKDRALALDAPEPIRKLVEVRNQAPVFRYRADLNNRFLRRYYTNRSSQDIAIGTGDRGTAVGCLPHYLLIYGTPYDVPWDLQYILNTAGFVGRLDLENCELEHYIDALISNWADTKSQSDQPVVWAVDHGKDDISWLLRHAIAEPVIKKLVADPQIGQQALRLVDQEATTGKLLQALADKKPAFILTTSHGMTGPLDDKQLMARQLGLLVDRELSLLEPDKLLDQWQPDGAIWYAHACCSAGSDEKTRYKGLVSKGSTVEKTLESVAALGAHVAPLPKKLLGAEKPLRAFVGQVEPTFDWTVRQPETGQVLTTTLQEALYKHMYQAKPETIGMAFEKYFKHVGQLFAQWENATREIAKAIPGAEIAAVRLQLAALDRQSTVILGDPTACLPPL
jgi:hypothetical protein